MILSLSRYLRRIGSALALLSLAALLFAGLQTGTAEAAGCNPAQVRSEILAGPAVPCDALEQGGRSRATAASGWRHEKQYDAHGLPYVDARDLPREALHTLSLIKRSGPFPYKRDGVVFGNYERQLPHQRRGYYTEYTVKTPGAKNRGARRIIAGKGRTGDPATSGEYYYTADHYRSFARIRERDGR